MKLWSWRRQRGFIVAEAMTIFHMPVYKELKEDFGVRKAGKSKSDHHEFWKFLKTYNMENRFFNRNLAGGTMLNIGVYALSFYPVVYGLQGRISFIVPDEGGAYRGR